MSFDAANLPPVRGQLGANPSFGFMIVEGVVGTEQILQQYLLCTVQLSATLSKTIYCFTPCLTSDTGVLRFDLDDTSTPITEINLVDENQTYNIVSFVPTVFPVSFVGSNNYRFNIAGGGVDVSMDTIPKYPSPSTDRTVLFTSFPYQAIVSTKALNPSIYILSRGNEIQSQKDTYSFAYIDADNGVASARILPSFITYFVPQNYFTDATNCPLVTNRAPVLEIIRQWSLVGGLNVVCPAGTKVPPNQNCGWIDANVCATSFFFDYCDASERCGTCFGECANENPCLLAIRGSSIAFTCESPAPAPPTPEPNPPNTVSFWKKYGRSIVITCIVIGVFIFLAIFIGWLLPKKSQPIVRPIIRVTKEEPPRIQNF
jgi:hypothetical protein